MVSSIGSNVNSLQMLRATNAFKSASRPLKNNDVQESSEIEDSALIESYSDIKMQVAKDDKLTGINKFKLNEINDIANKINMPSLSEDDINYGLRYGRSVLVDYSA